MGCGTSKTSAGAAGAPKPQAHERTSGENAHAATSDNHVAPVTGGRDAEATGPSSPAPAPEPSSNGQRSGEQASSKDVAAAAQPEPPASEAPAAPEAPADGQLAQSKQHEAIEEPPSTEHQGTEAPDQPPADVGKEQLHESSPTAEVPSQEPPAREPPAAESPVAEQPAEEELPFKPFVAFIAHGKVGDAKYRKHRVKARYKEPVDPPKDGLPPDEESELKRVWQEEWHGFPKWTYVLLARLAVGPSRWRAMGSDRQRAAVERFLLCGPWAATQEPDPDQLSRMRSTSSSSRFVVLGHPARRDHAIGAFCAAHDLAKTIMLQSDRPNNPGYYDVHDTTGLGDKFMTAEVCHKIVVPATRAFGASYVDLFLGPELWPDNDPQSRDTPQKGYFLSHAWGMPFMQLVTVAIIDGAPPRHDNGPYWIDIFCKNQHVPIQESDLTDNILRSSTVLLAVHPWPRPLLVTRVWCLFEVLTAVQTQVDLRLKFCESAARGLQDSITKKYDAWNYSKVYDDIMSQGLSSIMPGAGEMVEAIDVRQAEATVASDRDMIMRLIENGVGADKMNELVREMLVKGLATAAQTLVQANVGQDRLAYYSYEPGCD